MYAIYSELVLWCVGFRVTLLIWIMCSILQYKLFFLGVRPLESRCVLLVVPSTIPLVTTIWYRMVLDSKYHRIYGTIESMMPAQLCSLVPVSAWNKQTNKQTRNSGFESLHTSSWCANFWRNFKGYSYIFWVTYMPKSSTKSQPSNQPTKRIENRNVLDFLSTKNDFGSKPKKLRHFFNNKNVSKSLSSWQIGFHSNCSRGVAGYQSWYVAAVVWCL